LRRKGLKVVLTREVGGCPSAEEIRKLWLAQGEGYWEPLSELLLIFAARHEHLTKTIWPALKRGTWVISDRFMDSTRAYQGAAGPIEKLYREIAGNFEPDMTLLLDTPVSISMARVKARGGWNDRYQLKEAAFHRKLRKSYLALAKKYKRRITVIDASQSEIRVAKTIEMAVLTHFKLKIPT
jgi:dTMP kinase